MAFLDPLNAALIKTLPNGERVFFPYGGWGGGYLIPTHEDYDRVQRLIGAYTIVAFAISVVTAMVSERWLLVVSPSLFVFYLLFVRIVLDGLRPSTAQMTFNEALVPYRRVHRVVTWSVLLAMCMSGLLTNVVFIARDRNVSGATLPMILLFGAGAAFCVRMALRKRRDA